MRNIFAEKPIFNHTRRKGACPVKILSFWLILAFFIPVLVHSYPALAGERTAIVVRSQSIAAYTEAIKGFEEGCRKHNISISGVFDMNGDADEGKKIVKNLRQEHARPDLILSVGVLATALVKEQFTDIPVIFCMVINHERFNLEGTNMTGISSEASLEDQFGVLREILGTGRQVGIIYDPTKTGKIIAEAEGVTKRLGFSLVRAEVGSEGEVAAALDGMLNKIQALWIVPDGTVVTREALETILRVTQKRRLPVFCTSSAIVKAGALVSISPDYRHTGLQAAELAGKLLANPAVGSLGVRKPEKLKVTVNTQTAGQIRVDVTPLRSRSDVVFYP